MTDTDKLKRLAELLRFGDTSGEYSKAILALIAENEALTTGGIIEVAVRNPSVSDYVGHWEGRAERAERERDEAVALLREFMNEGDTSSVYNDVDAFLARIDAKR